MLGDTRGFSMVHYNTTCLIGGKEENKSNTMEDGKRTLSINRHVALKIERPTKTRPTVIFEYKLDEEPINTKYSLKIFASPDSGSKNINKYNMKKDRFVEIKIAGEYLFETLIREMKDNSLDSCLHPRIKDIFMSLTHPHSTKYIFHFQTKGDINIFLLDVENGKPVSIFDTKGKNESLNGYFERYGHYALLKWKSLKGCTMTFDYQKGTIESDNNIEGSSFSYRFI